MVANVNILTTAKCMRNETMLLRLTESNLVMYVRVKCNYRGEIGTQLLLQLLLELKEDVWFRVRLVALIAL